MPLRNPDTAHWRDSARTAKLWGLDAFSLVPMIPFFFYMRTWTFVIAVVGVAFFAILNKFGYTVRVFLRVARNFIAGRQKITRY